MTVYVRHAAPSPATGAELWRRRAGRCAGWLRVPGALRRDAFSCVAVRSLLRRGAVQTRDITRDGVL